MSYITPIGMLGLVAIAACWALAVVLYRVGTPGSVSQVVTSFSSGRY